MGLIKFFKKQNLFIKAIISFVVLFLIGMLFFGSPSGSSKTYLASILTGSEKDEVEEDILPIVELINISDFSKNNFAISVTGELESSNQVEIKSQVSAKVKEVRVGLGQETYPGQVLVVFENDDIYAQLMQAEAGLEAAQARLSETEKGARSEQVKIVQSQFNNAELSFKEAKQNLENTKNKTKADTNSAYNSASNALISAVNAGKNALLLVTDLQSTYFFGSSQDGIKIANAKQLAMKALLEENDAGQASKRTVSDANGGIYGLVKGVITSSQIDTALIEVEEALKAIRILLDTIPAHKINSIDNASLNFEKSSINGQISSVTGSKQGLAVLKAGISSLLTGAQMSFIGAQSAFENAQNQLDLILAGATEEQLIAQRSGVKSAQATVNLIQSHLNKTIIRSPIKGKVAVLPVRVGELINPGQIISSIVNTGGLEIKAYIDSSNLSFIGVGNKVLIENSISGLITNIAPSIDPLKKKVEVRIIVTNQEQSRLVIGQFVNISISVNEDLLEANIYLIPLQSIKITSNDNFVYILNEENIVEEHSVKLGRVIGESVEVLEGLNSEMNIVSLVRGIQAEEKVKIK